MRSSLRPIEKKREVLDLTKLGISLRILKIGEMKRRGWEACWSIYFLKPLAEEVGNGIGADNRKVSTLRAFWEEERGYLKKRKELVSVSLAIWISNFKLIHTPIDKILLFWSLSTGVCITLFVASGFHVVLFKWTKNALDCNCCEKAQ